MDRFREYAVRICARLSAFGEAKEATAAVCHVDRGGPCDNASMPSPIVALAQLSKKA
jgi:hypothetical protein